MYRRIHQLPLHIQQKIWEYNQNDYTKRGAIKCSTFQELLDTTVMHVFCWENTDEGHVFWRNIYEGGPFPEEWIQHHYTQSFKILT